MSVDASSVKTSDAIDTPKAVDGSFIRLDCDCQIRQGDGFVHFCPAHQSVIDERVRDAVGSEELSGEAVMVMRRVIDEGLGFQATFVDDDCRILCALAQRAVLAGLASDCQPDTLRRFTEAAEKHREGHEKALGYKIPIANAIAEAPVERGVNS